MVIKSETELKETKNRNKRAIIISLIVVFLSIIIIVSGVIISNIISTQSYKNSIEESIKTKMWENAFDSVIQSDFPEHEKKDYLKRITPNMKESAENNKYNDFQIDVSYVYIKDDTNPRRLKIKYDNGDETEIYETINSKILERSSWNKNNLWVDGTIEYLGDSIYGNGIVLFATHSTKVTQSKPLTFSDEVTYYEYNIKDNKLNMLLTEKDEEYDRFYCFRKLYNGKIVIEEANNIHIYDPYSNALQKNVHIDIEDKDILYDTYPNDYT